MSNGNLYAIAWLINVVGIMLSVASIFAGLNEPYADLGDYASAIGTAVTSLLIPATMSHFAMWGLILVLASLLLFVPVMCARADERHAVVGAYLLVSPLWLLWLPSHALLIASEPSFNFYTPTKPAWLVSPLFMIPVLALPLIGVALYRRQLREVTTP